MTEINSKWYNSFTETHQDIIEDTLLLAALSAYALNSDTFLRDNGAGYFPQTFKRLCDYLSQHVLELHRLQKALDSHTGLSNQSVSPSQMFM
jgi:hypothetical protein